MTDAEKRQKEHEKKVAKFHKRLGVYGMSKAAVDSAVLNFAKGCNYGWGEIYLTPEQEKDETFMLALFKSNQSLLNTYYIPRDLKDNHKFTVEFLKLEIDLGKARQTPSGFGAYEYHRLLKDFGIRKNPEFLNLFARECPECNILEIIGRIVDEAIVSKGKEEEFERLCSALTKDVYISGARRFGARFVRYMKEENPYFMEVVLTGIEKDGFKSLAYLPTEKIWENRDLIALASKHDNFDGLKRYFLDTLSPCQERDYMCHGDLHTYTHMEYEFYPLRKALIEDDALFAQIEGDKKDIEKLRAFIKKETKEFYDQVKPYEERGLVAPKENKGQTVGSAMTSFLFGEDATAEDEAKTITVVEKIAQNVQRSKNEGK